MSSDKRTDNTAGEWPLRLRDAVLILPANGMIAAFSHINTVGILLADGLLRIFPVHDAAQGGRLLKLRNANGDRAVHIGDLLEDQSPYLHGEWQLEGVWEEASGLLSCRIENSRRIANP